MEQSAKEFADRLNRCLDELNVPANPRERPMIFSKMMNIPRQQAWALLEGQLLPDEELLSLMAKELDLDPKDLL